MSRNPLTRLLAPGPADAVVPPSGHTAWLTLFTAGAMTFLAVFALALALASGRLAERWAGALERTATVRLSAPEDQIDRQVKAVLDLLSTTPGISSARALDLDEQRKLLEPWFGPDLPVQALPLPRLIEVVEDGSGYDAKGCACGWRPRRRGRCWTITRAGAVRWRWRRRGWSCWGGCRSG